MRKKFQKRVAKASKIVFPHSTQVCGPQICVPEVKNLFYQALKPDSYSVMAWEALRRPRVMIFSDLS